MNTVGYPTSLLVLSKLITELIAILAFGNGKVVSLLLTASGHTIIIIGLVSISAGNTLREQFPTLGLQLKTILIKASIIFQYKPIYTFLAFNVVWVTLFPTSAVIGHTLTLIRYKVIIWAEHTIV